jgi:hypothetical protein
VVALGSWSADKKDVNVTPVLAPTPLSAADRCDRCGARAYLRAVLPSGSALLFCAHHAREHAAALKHVAVEFEDHTDHLEEIPPTAPEDER